MCAGCANRMRDYVLPRLGYRLEGTDWVYEGFPDPQLQRVPDRDVEQHHLGLTARMLVAVGRRRWRALRLNV